MVLTYNIKLKIHKGRKRVADTHSYKRKRIHHFLNLSYGRGCRYWLRVRYSDGTKNIGEYTSKKDAKHALSAFTEKGLLKIDDSNRYR